MFLYILLFYTVDILAFFLFEHQFLYLLPAFLIAIYWCNNNTIPLALGIFLLACESLIIHNVTLLCFFEITPLFAIIRFLQNRTYFNIWQPGVLMAMLLLTDICIAKILIHGEGINSTYTMATLFGNIAIVLIFSLKLSRRKTRQSLISLV